MESGGGDRLILTLKLSTHSGQLYGYFKRAGKGEQRTLKQRRVLWQFYNGSFHSEGPSCSSISSYPHLDCVGSDQIPLVGFYLQILGI